MMNPAEFANIATVEDSFWWFAGMHRILLRLLRPHFERRKPGRILEAGCGTGGFAARLAGEWNCPLDLTDLAPEGLAHARRRGFARLVEADIRALPFQNAAYDCVISLDVLVHFPRGGEEPAMAEMARVLAPGGLLVIRVSALDILRSRHSRFTFEHQRFTRRRLIDAATRQGLEPLRCTYLNSLLLPVSLFKFRVWEPLVSAPPASGLRPQPAWLDKALRTVLNVECALLSRGLNFPAGQSLLLLARKPAAARP